MTGKFHPSLTLDRESHTPFTGFPGKDAKGMMGPCQGKNPVRGVEGGAHRPRPPCQVPGTVFKVPRDWQAPPAPAPPSRVGYSVGLDRPSPQGQGSLGKVDGAGGGASRIPALLTPSRQRGDAGCDALSGRSAARILEVGTLGNHLVAKRAGGGTSIAASRFVPPPNATL